MAKSASKHRKTRAFPGRRGPASSQPVLKLERVELSPALFLLLFAGRALSRGGGRRTGTPIGSLGSAAALDFVHLRGWRNCLPALIRGVYFQLVRIGRDIRLEFVRVGRGGRRRRRSTCLGDCGRRAIRPRGWRVRRGRRPSPPPGLGGGGVS